MGPAEIVASLKELCAEKGPRLTTEQIVAWIDRHGRLRVRRRADRLRQEDEGAAVRPDARRTRTKRPGCGSSGSGASATARRGRRFYADILADCPPTAAAGWSSSTPSSSSSSGSVRRAMADYFAGQQFFDFYPGEPEEDEDRQAASRESTKRRS